MRLSEEGRLNYNGSKAWYRQVVVKGDFRYVCVQRAGKAMRAYSM